MFSLKKTFYKSSFCAFGRKVYMYVLIKFQIPMCYNHGRTLINIVTSKQNVAVRPHQKL